MQKRATRQKQVISEVLTTAECPLTVHEVLERGQKYLQTLGIATVYREINRLSAEKALRVVNIPGDPPRYEVAHHHHHHFKCTICGAVYELEGCLKEINRLVPKGFQHQHHDITIYGVCRDCSR